MVTRVVAFSPLDTAAIRAIVHLRGDSIADKSGLAASVIKIKEASEYVADKALTALDDLGLFLRVNTDAEFLQVKKFVNTLSSLQMMLQLSCFEVLVMLSFMLPRAGSKENGFFEIFI